jgi:hypothetical protein
MIWRKDTVEAQPKAQPRGFDDYDLSLGDVMRGERATLGKSLLDVQRELHIRANLIAAIEDGDLSAFDTPGFVAGFVRSYSRYLGLDPEWAYEKFCAEHNFAVHRGMTEQPRQTPAKPVAKADPLALGRAGMIPEDRFWQRVEPGALGSVTLLAALILGLGFAGWTVLREVQRVQVAPADMVPAVTVDLDPVRSGSAPAGALVDADPLTAPRLPGAAGAAQGIVRLTRPDALDVPVVVPRDGPIAAINPRAGLEAGATDAAVLAALDDLMPDTAAPRVLHDGPAQVAVLAVRPSWVRVSAADGTVLFEKILDAGERYLVPATEQAPVLRAGNSGSVYFLVDGQARGPAAPGANVVRNIALSAEALRDGFQLADLDADPDLAVQVARAGQ